MDSWCSPVRAKTGKIVSGGAARNARISASGGMDRIIEQVASDAARNALELANQRLSKPKLRVVGR